MRRLKLPYNARLNSLLEERDDLSVQISMAENTYSAEAAEKSRRLLEIDGEVDKEWSRKRHA